MATTSPTTSPVTLPLYQVDAFAERLFTGNPAAVVWLEPEQAEQLDDGTLQAIAAENNLAETAFIRADGDAFHIRWFTPAVEVDLCGHATLASAHVLFEHRGVEGAAVTFGSRSGPLHVRRDGDVLVLDFPIDAPQAVDLPDALAQGIGATPREVYRGRDDFLAILDSEAAVAAVQPRMDLIATLPSRGLIVSAPGETVDFVSRFFGPQCGVPEDAVTGSAHTLLIPYWAQRLGRSQLHARQISQRSGDLFCRHLDPRVEIGGRAITYLTGQLVLPSSKGAP